MRGHADTYQRAAGGDLIGNVGGAFEEEGERAGPEGCDEAFGFGRDCGDLMEHVEVATWTMRGSQAGRCLAWKIFSTAVGLRALAPEAVYGFGREGYRASGAQDLSGLGYVVRGGGEGGGCSSG